MVSPLRLTLERVDDSLVGSRRVKPGLWDRSTRYDFRPRKLGAMCRSHLGVVPTRLVTRLAGGPPMAVSLIVCQPHPSSTASSFTLPLWRPTCSFTTDRHDRSSPTGLNAAGGIGERPTPACPFEEHLVADHVVALLDGSASNGAGHRGPHICGNVCVDRTEGHRFQPPSRSIASAWYSASPWRIRLVP